MTFLLESLSRLVTVLIALISRDPALTPPTSHCPAVEAFLAQTSLEIRTKMCYSRKNLNKSKIFWSIWIHFYPFWSIHPILTMLLGRILLLLSEMLDLLSDWISHLLWLTGLSGQRGQTDTPTWKSFQNVQTAFNSNCWHISEWLGWNLSSSSSSFLHWYQHLHLTTLRKGELFVTVSLQ